MDKKIYDLLNDAEIDLNAYNHEELTDIEKRKLKKRFKKSIRSNQLLYRKGIAAAVALLMIGVFTINFGGPVWAYANTIAYDIASYLGIEKSLDEYKTVVNESITRNGVTIQLNEVVLNNTELVVSTTVTTNEALQENTMVSLDRDIYINGKSAFSSAGGSSTRIDEHTMQEVMNYKLEGDLSGELNIKIVLSDLSINDSKKPGRWVFEFKTNGEDLRIDTKEILLDYAFTLEDGLNITLEKYASNNLGQKIYYVKNEPGSKNPMYDIVLRGHDDLGNKVDFHLSNEKDGHGILKLETINGNLSDDAKELFLTPYAVKFPDQSGQMSNDFKKVGEEFTINLLQ